MSQFSNTVCDVSPGRSNDPAHSRVEPGPMKPFHQAAAAVNGLNVDPGANRPLIASSLSAPSRSACLYSLVEP